jgi:hypothetical protein
LLALTLISIPFLLNHSTQAENSGAVSEASQASKELANQVDQSPMLQTFTGIIVKSGDKFVLSDPLTKTSYQLDDQRKAQNLVNKNVRVIEVLDPSTETIRVSAVQPN